MILIPISKISLLECTINLISDYSNYYIYDLVIFLYSLIYLIEQAKINEIKKKKKTSLPWAVASQRRYEKIVNNKIIINYYTV